MSSGPFPIRCAVSPNSIEKGKIRISFLMPILSTQVSTPTGLGPMDQEDEVISHYEYDHRELSKIVMQILIGSCIVGYMHFSCGAFWVLQCSSHSLSHCP